MKCSLLGEIHLFHSGTINLSEYPAKVKQLRTMINNISQIEMEYLNKMLEDNQISNSEYEKMKEIIAFKKMKYQEMVNLI